MDGRAEMTYLMPATRFSEETTVVVEKGDCYIIPAGAEIYWKVDPAGPLRRLNVIMPGPTPYEPELMVGPFKES